MINFAIVGKGKWGQNYIKTISQLEDCLLPQENIRTRDYKKLLKNKKIDVVIIATPASTHFKIAKEFLENGFNLLIEKPLTLNYKEARKLLKIQKRNRNRVMIGHLYLYHPAFWKLKKEMKQIGRIDYIYSEGMDYGPIREDTTALWDWAPHDLSMMVSLLDEWPVKISAWEISERSMYCLKLKFKKTTAIINIGWLSAIKKRNLTIAGEKGSLIFDDVQDKKIQLIRNSKITYPSYSSDLPLMEEIKEFMRCISHRKKSFSDLSFGVKIVKTIETAEQSVKAEGKELNILYGKK